MKDTSHKSTRLNLNKSPETVQSGRKQGSGCQGGEKDGIPKGWIAWSYMGTP